MEDVGLDIDISTMVGIKPSNMPEFSMD